MPIKIRAHVPCDNELIRDLQRRRIELHQMRSGLIVVTLPEIGSQMDYELAGLTAEEAGRDTTSSSDLLPTPRRFQLVEGCNDVHRLHLYGGEQGGWTGGDGFARVICATNGTRLTPFTVAKNNQRWHAHFCSARFNTSRTIVEVLATTPAVDRYSDVMVVRYEIVVEGDQAVAEPTLLWQGRHYELTPDNTDPTVDHVPLSVFIGAVSAANKKARCQKCAHAHYAQERQR